MKSTHMRDSNELNEAIRASAHDLLRAESPLSRLRAFRDTNPGYEQAVWTKLAEAGWTGLLAPEEVGGLDLGLGAACVVATEVGRHPIPEPFIAGCIHSVALLTRLPLSDLRRELLQTAISGERIIGVAWQEDVGQQIATRGTALHTDCVTSVLNGVKRWVYPANAHGWLVMDSTTNTVVWLSARSDGITAAVHSRVDGTMAATLEFKDVKISPKQVLARGEEAYDALSYANNVARAVQAAELLGIAKETFDRTLEYLKTRVQFGKPIGANQALQHRMVDAYLQVRMAEAVLTELLANPDLSDQLAEARCARVKARCAHAALHMSRLAIQFHGAIGYTDELDIGLYLKRALHLSSWLGGVLENRRLAQRLTYPHAEPSADVLFPDTPTSIDWNAMPEDEFRSMVRGFVRAHYPSALRNPSKRLHWEEIQDWYMALSRQGWLAPAWPREHGGMGLTPAKLIAFMEEMEAYGVARTPDQGIINIGPVLIRYGNEAQRKKYLPKILTGENIWCQGYSEPNAGSDLASLNTQAVEDRDDFVVNGQKIWTTLAQDATHIFLLVRTDNTVKKQAGISFLLVDMKTPGITVRPIRNIGGEEEFCEVFFDNVRVPKEDLVGELNDGWSIAKALLDFERLFVGSPSQCWLALSQLKGAGQKRNLLEDRAFQDKFVASFLDVMDLQALYGEFAEIVKRGDVLPPSVSLLKIWATETYSRICMETVETAADWGGDDVILRMHDIDIHPARRLYNSAITTIYGGANEIQRNILAKLVLAL